jgi:GxxExxY protein
MSFSGKMAGDELSALTQRILGLAIEVHRNLGPGLLESIYEAALCVELQTSGLQFERQKMLPVFYKGHAIGDFRIDLLVENTVLLELKSVDRHEPVFEAQVISYLRISGIRLGLLINFNAPLLKDGVRRFVN